MARTTSRIPRAWCMRAVSRSAGAFGRGWRTSISTGNTPREPHDAPSTVFNADARKPRLGWQRRRSDDAHALARFANVRQTALSHSTGGDRPAFEQAFMRDCGDPHSRVRSKAGFVPEGMSTHVPKSPRGRTCGLVFAARSRRGATSGSGPSKSPESSTRRTIRVPLRTRRYGVAVPVYSRMAAVAAGDCRTRGSRSRRHCGRATAAGVRLPMPRLAFRSR